MFRVILWFEYTCMCISPSLGNCRPLMLQSTYTHSVLLTLWRERQGRCLLQAFLSTSTFSLHLCLSQLLGPVFSVFCMCADLVNDIPILICFLSSWRWSVVLCTNNRSICGFQLSISGSLYKQWIYLGSNSLEMVPDSIINILWMDQKANLTTEYIQINSSTFLLLILMHTWISSALQETCMLTRCSVCTVPFYKRA